MKKITAFIMAFVLSLIVFSEKCYAIEQIVDQADLFTPEEEAELLEMICAFQKDTALDFVVFTSNKPHDGKTIKEIADAFYDENGYGYGTDKGGILYFIDMYDRIPYLSTTGRMIMHMTDSRIYAAHEVSYDALASGKYAFAVAQMVSVVKAFVYD